MDEQRQVPMAFLCHASEDNELAERLATALQEAGIETFFSPWSIGTGESLRQKIDSGLAGCTHFVALLTPVSIGKSWVNVEIDAAFLRRVKGQCKFLPIRYNLPIERLPPLLAALHAPQLTDATYESDLRGLIGEIYGISQKPPLGETPEYAKPQSTRRSGLSLGAEKVVHLLASQSVQGRRGDPRIRVEAILTATSLTIEELEIAVDELESKGLVQPARAAGCPPPGYYAVEPHEALFIEFDPLFMAWNPREDAVRLAAELINSGKHWLPIAETAERLNWEPRRMNPALAFLIRQGAVLPSNNLDLLFVAIQVTKNNRTARFLHAGH